MFYITRVQAINGGTVTDTTGRRLQFIGDLPVKVGDTICTDGKYIFGHAPPRGAPAIFDEPSGIPVLADSDSSGDKELRGYFDTTGRFNKFKIKGEEWIVNDKKYYAHDDSDADIIDAEFADDGSLLTAVVDSKTHDTNFPTIFTQKNNLISLKDDKRGDYDPDNPYWQCSFSFDNLQKTSSYHLDPPKVEIIYPDISFLDSHFAKYDEQIYKTCNLKIQLDNKILEEIDTNIFLEDIVSKSLKDFMSIKIENTTIEEHIAVLFQWLSFKLMPDGSWQALFNLEIWAERGFHGNNTPLVLWSTSTYEPAMLHIRQIIKLEKKTTYEILLKQQTHYPILFYVMEEKTITFDRAPGAEYDSWQIEERGYSFPWEYHYPRATTFWGDDTVSFTVHFVLVFDSRLLNSMELIDEHVDQFEFPIQDSAVGIFKPSGDKKWQLAEIKYKDDSDDEKSIILSFAPQNSHDKNWCFSLARNGYLVGIHDGALYKVNADGNFEQVGSGLKNFRLRELKPINKARR